MENLQYSIYHYVDPYEIIEAGPKRFQPIRIAILDSGFDPENPLVRQGDGLDPRIKDARSFVHGTGIHDYRDEIGHGTHALGLLLKVATCADIYIGKIAHRESLNRNSYDDMAKASLNLFRSRLSGLMLNVHLGHQSRSFCLECRHHLHVIRDS